ncbi:hypothetical protein C0991_010651 [Blastosporella zonata]|nr:hypothetical protein C0991_010651 [Blastosporella zonata]
MAEISPQLQSSTETKLETAKQKKATGDQAFKKDDVKAALLSYHEALLYLLGLDKNALQSIGIGSTGPLQKDKDGKEIKEKTEVDELLEKVYANMSACHLKNSNWKRAVDTADKVSKTRRLVVTSSLTLRIATTKALAKNESNYKAMFRKAKGLGEQGFIEKAIKLLEEVKEKNPSGQHVGSVCLRILNFEALDATICNNELSRLRILDKKRDKENKEKLKGEQLLEHVVEAALTRTRFLEPREEDREVRGG